MNIAVVGSGLSAIGAIKALVKQGVKPIVLDWGEELDERRSQFVNMLAQKPPAEWTQEERVILTKNSTLNDGSSIPKKLIFGSDYFYGKSRQEAPVIADGNPPPFSYAVGGLSVGWGAAVLPPQKCDLLDWPLEVDELNKYIEIVLSDLPYSANNDELELDFPVLSSCAAPLDLSKTDIGILNSLKKTSPARKGELVYGQARLLVSSAKSGSPNACKSCGQCMSGCVYKSIYKANAEISKLIEQDKITYVSGCLVTRLSEHDGVVSVVFVDEKGSVETKQFDKVFLAAGAVNSTRIVLNSLGIVNKKACLKTRGGFVLPIFSLRKLESGWPNCNTQPGIFLELKGRKLSHWTHIQLSTANELLLQKLNISSHEKGLFAKIKHFVVDHLMLALVNYHSEHSGEYELWVEERLSEHGESSMKLNSRHRKKLPQFSVLFFSCLKMLKIFIKIGAVPVFPLARLNSGSYHVGGALPMRLNPVGDMETDTLGRLSEWDCVHVVDTSVFPSLPGTTIGLLAMANAYRIAENSVKEECGMSK